MIFNKKLIIGVQNYIKTHVKNYIFFLNINCNVYYYSVKFEINIQLVYGVIKKEKLYYGVKWTKWHSLGGKLDQVIV